MRHIDTSLIIVPPNWIDLARNQLGNTYPSLWSFFKSDFEKIVGKKCWYSESDNSGSVNPIDHFRPKAIKIQSMSKHKQLFSSHIWLQLNANERKGYDFLEHEFSNYRYACAIVNSPNKRETPDEIVRGKWDYFPLRNDSIFATSLAEIPNEIIYFLDPCNRKDPDYLTFNELGDILPHNSLLNNSWEYCRVIVSIEMYHLRYPYFVEKRKELWDSCAEHIELVDGLFHKNSKTDGEKKNIAFHIKELNKKTGKKMPFSAVAIDCILNYKRKRKYIWLDTFFPDNKLQK